MRTLGLTFLLTALFLTAASAATLVIRIAITTAQHEAATERDSFGLIIFLVTAAYLTALTINTITEKK